MEISCMPEYYMEDLRTRNGTQYSMFCVIFITIMIIDIIGTNNAFF